MKKKQQQQKKNIHVSLLMVITSRDPGHATYCGFQYEPISVKQQKCVNTDSRPQQSQ